MLHIHNVLGGCPEQWWAVRVKGGVVRLKRLNFNADDVDSRQVESRESRVACGVFSFRLKSADGILGAALFVPLGAAS